MMKAEVAGWEGTARSSRHRAPFTWNGLLWGFVAPNQTNRIVPTVPGTVIVALAFGIGMAAYNSSSNILFLTLALLLACIVLSGVLSWLNFRRVTWRLRLPGAFRAGHDALIAVDVRNGKRVLPTYGVWFNLRVQPALRPGELRPESTVTARGADVREALARADRSDVRGRVALAGRLGPAGEARLDWVFKPERRGRIRVGVQSVGSLFPFGFLRKDVASATGLEAVVWPATVAYVRHGSALAQRPTGDERVTRPGGGNDLIALRRYAVGDSHRLIHWKASARTRQLLVRQFAAESAQTFSLWIRAEPEVWPRPDQFELLVSFVASLGEDLYRAGRLSAVAVAGQPPLLIRGVRDLERFLDELASLEAATSVVSAPPPGEAIVTFLPDGLHGVRALVAGECIATA